MGGQNFKVHLDGYDQTNIITGKGPSNRHEIFYFAEGKLGAVRINDYKYRFIDQPNGWIGTTVTLDMPLITNLRLDPLERVGFTSGANGSFAYMDFFVHEFWRFVFVQQEVEKAALTFKDFPPMQKGASFNMEAVKAQIVKAMSNQDGARS